MPPIDVHNDEYQFVDSAPGLLERLTRLRQTVAAEGEERFERWRPLIKRLSFLPSAFNLAMYLALRRHDLRPLQAALMPWGLSSLGRSESRVLPSLDAVLRALAALSPGAPFPISPVPGPREFFMGERLLRRQVRAVFGPAHTGRQVRIMVTLPAEAASDYAWVRQLVLCGMNCARINCAHGNAAEWKASVGHIRQAERETGRTCHVLMDLGGPRARLGETLSPLPARRLFPGDRLLLTRSRPEPSDEFPLQAQCEPSEILDQLTTGTHVMIDEGKIVTVVERRVAEGCLVSVVRTGSKGGKFRAELGLNFPSSTLRLPSLSTKDLSDLDVIVQLADIVGYSFVQEPHDMDQLNDELDARADKSRRLSISIKIETARAVRNLPELIVHGAGRRPLAVMIARGDLAVELGYERLAEMQEEIMWLAEAAYVPVTWATQVLERLVKKGTPSRAEITDAAMAVRAECVMLNKGPHVLHAVSILDDVLSRMQHHQNKKTPQLRALRSWSFVKASS